MPAGRGGHWESLNFYLLIGVKFDPPLSFDELRGLGDGLGGDNSEDTT